MAKDILWFHAVIWPCMLMALKDGDPKCYGFVELPRRDLFPRVLGAQGRR